MIVRLNPRGGGRVPAIWRGARVRNKPAVGLTSLADRVGRPIFDFLGRAQRLLGLADELVRPLEACSKRGLGFVNLFVGGMVWHWRVVALSGVNLHQRQMFQAFP